MSHLVVLLEGSVLKDRWPRRGIGLATGSGGGWRGGARRVGTVPPEAVERLREVAALCATALPVASSASLPLAAGDNEVTERHGCPQSYHVARPYVCGDCGDGV